MNPKTVIILVSLVLTAVAFLIFGLPRIRAIQSLRGDLLEQKSAFTAMREKLESTRGVVAQFQSIEERDRELVAFALPASLDLPNLLVQLETLISSSGLASEAIEVKGVGTINVTALGNYESLKVFLKELERSLRIFDVETISFTSPALSEGGAENFRFSLSLKTYYSAQGGSASGGQK